MSPPDDGPGLLVQCGFGNEERAVGEVRAALGSTATTRGAVSHKGLGWLALDDAAAADATSAFAALVGAPTPACPTPPDPAVLRNCQALFPVSRACAADAASVRAATRAEATRAIASGAVPALARPDARVAVAVHIRGDDSHASRDNGAPPRARADVIAAALAGLADARAPTPPSRLPPRTSTPRRRRRPRRAVAQTVPRLRRRREPRRGRVREPTGRERPDVWHRHPPEDAVRRPLEGYLPREDNHQRTRRRRETSRTRGRPPTGCRPTGCRARCRAIRFRSGRARGPAAREWSHRSDRARAAKTAKTSASAAPHHVPGRIRRAAPADGPRRRRRRARRRDRAKTRRGTPPAGRRDGSTRR